jgi:hypothetical protein
MALASASSPQFGQGAVVVVVVVDEVVALVAIAEPRR